MPKLTALIPCYNESVNLAECLESVRFADEIVVVDSFSTDDTVEIARRYTDRVLIHEYVNSATQKNWAIPQCSHEWVLIVDADERIPKDLAAEIQRVVAADGPLDAYWIARRNVFLGRPIRGCGWQGDGVTRLFRRDRGRYEDRHVHASLLVEGTVGRLRAPMLHYSYRALYSQLVKMWRYSGWGAEDAHRRGRRAGPWRLIAYPLHTFLHTYFVRGGWRDGVHGVVLCGLQACGVFLKYARLWEMQLFGVDKAVGPRDPDLSR